MRGNHPRLQQRGCVLQHRRISRSRKPGEMQNGFTSLKVLVGHVHKLHTSNLAKQCLMMQGANSVSWRTNSRTFGEHFRSADNEAYEIQLASSWSSRQWNVKSSWTTISFAVFVDCMSWVQSSAQNFSCCGKAGQTHLVLSLLHKQVLARPNSSRCFGKQWSWRALANRSSHDGQPLFGARAAGLFFARAEPI